MELGATAADERATLILEGKCALGANATAADAPARKREAQNFIFCVKKVGDVKRSIFDLSADANTMDNNRYGHCSSRAEVQQQQQHASDACASCAAASQGKDSMIARSTEIPQVRMSSTRSTDEESNE